MDNTADGTALPYEDLLATSPSEDQALLEARVVTYRRQLLAAGGVGLVNSALTAAVFAHTVDWRLLGVWLLAVWFISGRSLFAWWRDRHRVRRSPAQPRHLRRIVGATLVAGLAWGSAGFLFFPESSVPLQLFLVFVLGGMAAGATAGFSCLPSIWLCYVVPLVAPLIVRLIDHGDPLSHVMAAMLSVFAASLLVMTRSTYAAFASGVASRVRVERMVRRVEASRSELVDAVESIPDGFVLFDADDRLVLCNEHFREIYAALAPCCVPGTPFRDLAELASRTYAADRTEEEHERWIEERLEQHRMPGGPVEIEQGVGRWVRVAERRTSDGGTVGVYTDVSDRKLAELALREGDQQLAALAQNIPGVVFQRVRKPDGRIEYPFVSKRVQSLLGVDPNDLMANAGRVWELIHPADREQLRSAVETSVAAMSPIRMAYRVVPPDGGIRWLHVWSQPRRLANGDVLWDGVALDDTERHEAVERARAHEAELARVQRVATMGEMTSALAHQLNQPLNAIANYLRGSLRRMRSGTDPAELAPIMELACSQAERAATTVRGIADFVRKTEQKVTVVDVHYLVRSVAQLAEAELADHGVQLVLDLAPSLPRIKAVAIELEQAILNVLRNGVESMAAVERARRRLTIRTRRVADGSIEVVVADTGTGLTAEAADQLFEPFFSTKDGNMGMGLAISRNIIAAQGGSIRAESNADGGASFVIRLAVGD